MACKILFVSPLPPSPCHCIPSSSPYVKSVTFGLCPSCTKLNWDTEPWHLLFPGPPALSRVFLKVLFVYHGISVQRAGGRDPAGPKLSLRAHPLSLLSPPVPLSHSLVPHLFQLLCSCLSRPVLILFVSTGYGLPLLPQREGRLPKRPACPHQGAAAVRLRP